MNNTTIINAVRYAIANGAAPIQFDKICNAGGYARHFAGKGILYITPDMKRLYISGDDGFITQAAIHSENESVEYIMSSFDSFTLDETHIKERAKVHTN